ncbi:MAG: helix-turn-helix transcriptional regulator [Chloroflexi bacterium]|nr:helix-turn-helix transcriptional regulator [Chloroflexota bacterium]
MALKKLRQTILMLDLCIAPTVRYMGPEFTSHDFIDKLREIYPADYAHDLALGTQKHGFPLSLQVLHRAVVARLRRSDRVDVIGKKGSRDLRGNPHPTLVWRRLDSRRPPRKRGVPVPFEPKVAPPPAPTMSGGQLREARLARGWTKTELSLRAGVSLAAVSRWERDERRMGRGSYAAIQAALKQKGRRIRRRSAPQA